MMKYKILIDEEALSDIQEATEWYNEQTEGLGSRFQKQVKSQINSLKTDAEIHTNRYADVRCMLIKKFPFMVHYTIENLTVNISAVLHTSRNPRIWEERK
jgi:plasmid stabilization system protein ParE